MANTTHPDLRYQGTRAIPEIINIALIMSTNNKSYRLVRKASTRVRPAIFVFDPDMGSKIIRAYIMYCCWPDNIRQPYEKIILSAFNSMINMSGTIADHFLMSELAVVSSSALWTSFSYLSYLERPLLTKL